MAHSDFFRTKRIATPPFSKSLIGFKNCVPYIGLQLINNKKKMGKGDKKTRRGKISIGSHGKLRPRRKKFNIRPKTINDAQKKEA